MPLNIVFFCQTAAYISANQLGVPSQVHRGDSFELLRDVASDLGMKAADAPGVNHEVPRGERLRAKEIQNGVVDPRSMRLHQIVDEGLSSRLAHV